MEQVPDGHFRVYLMERRRLIKDELASIEKMLGIGQKEKYDGSRIEEGKARLNDLTNIARRMVR